MILSYQDLVDFLHQEIRGETNTKFTHSSSISAKCGEKMCISQKCTYYPIAQFSVLSSVFSALNLPQHYQCGEAAGTVSLGIFRKVFPADF